MPVTFDFPNLRINVAVGTTTIDVQVDLYSDWKEAQKTDPTAVGAPPAFRTTGGDPTGAGGANISPYFFLRNDLGWRILPADEDAVVRVEGNLFREDPTTPIEVAQPGRTIVIIFVVSPQSLTRGSGLSALEQTQLLDIYQRLGLDLSNPLTIKDVSIVAGGVSLVIAQPDGSTTTVTRQP